MACHAVMNTAIETVSPEDTVETVLKLMEKKDLPFLAVVDEKKTLLGLVSHAILLKNILPVSLSMNEDLQFNVKISAAPGIAKRFKKILPIKISDIMERKLHVVHPQTPMWEGVRALLQYGEPLMVVEPETERLAGVITGASALKEVQRLKESEQ